MPSIDFIPLIIPGILAALGAVVWLVRLEGKTTANAAAIFAVRAEFIANATKQDNALAAHVTKQDTANENIVRLQEQVRHLSDLIEKYFLPPTKRRPSGPAS